MKMHEMFGADPELEKTGVWIDYGDFRVRVARAGGSNRDFNKVLERLAKPYRRAASLDIMDTVKADEILRKAYVQSVILGWETKVNGEFKSGIEKPEGGDLLPFTRENVEKTLETLPDLFTDLREQSTRLAVFRKTIKEEEAKN